MTQKRLNFLHHPSFPPGYNMALDWWLLQSAESPVFRFYFWNLPVLSLGYRQQFRPPDRLGELADRFPVVQRPTGGGYLLHAGDFSFSLVFPTSHPWTEASIKTLYSRVVDLFEQVALEQNLLSRSERGSGGSFAADCLAAPAAHEPSQTGKKWIAISQLRHQKAALLHGSVFFDSTAWPGDVPLKTPFFLPLKNASDRRKYFSAVMTRLQGHLFPSDNISAIHIDHADWLEISRLAENFRVQHLSELPVFHR